MRIKKSFKKLLDFTIEKSPEILSICTIGGVIGTARNAYAMRPKCDEIIAKKKEKLSKIAQNDTKERRAVYLEGAKELFPVVAPTLILGAVTIASIIFNHKITKKRLLAITAAYNLADGSLKDLQKKMTETLGENKVREIKDEIMKDKVKNNPIPKDMIDDELRRTDDVRCYDSFSGRYFWSTWNKITEAILEVSAKASYEMYVTVNDFYDSLENPRLTSIDAGDSMGWRAEDTISGKLPITISTQLSSDNQPCLCIDYNNSIVNV